MNKKQEIVSKTILVVDDEADLREFISNFLCSMGYEVFQASSGKSALEFLTQNQKPILALVSDFNMPNMMGDELIYQANKYTNRFCAFVLATSQPDDHPQIQQLLSSRHLKAPVYYVEKFSEKNRLIEILDSLTLPLISNRS